MASSTSARRVVYQRTGQDQKQPCRPLATPPGPPSTNRTKRILQSGRPFSESPGWAYWQYRQANVLAQDPIDVVHHRQVLIRYLA